jgi:cbb3-type cytochrome oxidase subunit 3
MRWEALVVFVLALIFFEGVAYLIGKGRKRKKAQAAKFEITAQSSNNRHANPENNTSLHC